MASLTQKYLRECLSYNSDTGVLWWKVRPRRHFKNENGWRKFNSTYAHNRAGGVNTYGYYSVGISLPNERCCSYKAHRVIWFLIYGRWPTDEIDHIDGNRRNNRLSNLRNVSRHENTLNSGIQKTNSSGFTGVFFNKRYNNWLSRIKINGKQIHLGCFKRIDSAILARKTAEIKYGFFPNNRRDHLKERNAK